MGLLTDLWSQISEFLGIELVEPIVPETKEPPKPLEPKETETPLPEKTEAIAPVEEIKPLPVEPIPAPTPIGEQGRADRIVVLPERPELEAPFIESPSEEDYPCTMQFHARDKESGMPIANVDVTFLEQTETTDSTGKCSISGRMKVRKNYPIIASKEGYKTVETEISFAFAPRTGRLGADKRLDMERI